MDDGDAKGGDTFNGAWVAINTLQTVLESTDRLQLFSGLITLFLYISVLLFVQHAMHGKRNRVVAMARSSGLHEAPPTQYTRLRSHNVYK